MDIPLQHDPYIGPEAGDIDRSAEGFELVDLRTARLPVSLNGQVLDPGEHRRLEDGDVIGIGGTLLLFRT